jgi:hypothetical protein
MEKTQRPYIYVHASGARCAATLDFISLLLAAMFMCCCVERARKDNLGRDAPIGRGGFCVCDIACKFSTQRSRLPVWEINNMRARSNNARCMFFVVISEREIQRNLHALLCRVNSINLSEWENEWNSLRRVSKFVIKIDGDLLPMCTFGSLFCWERTTSLKNRSCSATQMTLLCFLTHKICFKEFYFFNYSTPVHFIKMLVLVSISYTNTP